MNEKNLKEGLFYFDKCNKETIQYVTFSNQYGVYVFKTNTYTFCLSAVDVLERLEPMQSIIRDSIKEMLG